MKKIKCVKCHEYKTEAEYYKRSAIAGGGLERQCKSCRKDHMKQNFRQYLFGMTMDEYLEKVQQQDNKCAICGAEHSDENRKVLVIDHNHETDNIRGLLCGNCNKGLGHFKDNITHLQNAIDYLRKHNETK